MLTLTQPVACKVDENVYCISCHLLHHLRSASALDVNHLLIRRPFVRVKVIRQRETRGGSTEREWKISRVCGLLCALECQCVWRICVGVPGARVATALARNRRRKSKIRDGGERQTVSPRRRASSTLASLLQSCRLRYKVTWKRVLSCAATT